MLRTRGKSFIAVVAALFVAGGAGVSACSSEEPFNPPLPSAETIASPSLSTGPTKPPEPTLPQAAKVNTPAGAEAFARYVISLYGYAFQAGDSWPLVAIAGPKCSFCDSVRDGVAEMKNDGNHVVGGELAVTWVSSAPDPRPGQAILTVAIRQKPGQEVDANGDVVDAFDITPEEPLLVVLTWKGEGWQLYDVGSGSDLK